MCLRFNLIDLIRSEMVLSYFPYYASKMREYYWTYVFDGRNNKRLGNR